MALLLDFDTHTVGELSDNNESGDFGSGSRILDSAKQFRIQDIGGEHLTRYWNNQSLIEQIKYELPTSASKQDLEFRKSASHTESVMTTVGLVNTYPFDELAQYQFDEFLESVRSLPQWIHSSPILVSEIDQQTIKFAEQFIKHLYDLILTNGLTWLSPHVGTDGAGEVSFEWWRNQNVLTIFVNPSGQIEYLKAWGPHIWREMEEGDSPTDQELLNLWQWLFA